MRPALLQIKKRMFLYTFSPESHEFFTGMNIALLYINAIFNDGKARGAGLLICIDLPGYRDFKEIF
jgi:hypothetical protein